MKRILFFSFLVANTLLFSQSYSGGDGSSSNPFIIENKIDLKYLSEHSTDWGFHFKQNTDITFNSSDFIAGGNFFNNGKGFIPIGGETVKFTGTYDGNNHTVTGLVISDTSNNNVGMFGYVDGVSSRISNLGLIGGSITGGDNVGGLVGYLNEGSVSNCYTTNTVYTENAAGGLMGEIYNGTISNCYTAGNISSNSYYSGGLVGEMYNGTISNSYTTSTISSGYVSGGLAGALFDATVTNCYVNSAISATNGFGGLFGDISNITINNSYYNKETTGTNLPYNGGLDVQGQAEGKTDAEMKTQTTFENWDFTNIWKMSSATGYPIFGTSTSLSTADLQKQKISLNIYPNPVDSFLNFSSNKNIRMIQIYNYEGKLVKTINIESIKINVESLEKGNYILKAVSEDGKIITKPFIKK